MPEHRSFDELVLVVHGVGDPEPGETLSLFARSVADQRQPLTEFKEVLWLEEQGDDPRIINTFGTNVRHLSFSGGRVSLAEVFWGDLSEVKKGTLGAIFGLIEIVFGLRFLAFVAADQACNAAKGMRWLGILISRIVHGPLLAVNTVLVVMAISAALSEVLWRGSSNDNDWARWMVGGSVGLCLLGSYLGGCFTPRKVLRRFWFWVTVCSFFLSGLLLLELFEIIEAPEFTAVQQVTDLEGAQHVNAAPAMTPQESLLFSIASAYSPSPFAMVAFNSIQPSTPFDSPVGNSSISFPLIKSLYCHFYCRAMVTLLGTLWLSLVVILIGLFICRLLTMLDRRTFGQAANVALLLPAISIGIWGVILPFAWIVLSQVIGKVIIIKEFDLIFSDAIPLLGVQLLVGLMITCILVLVLAKYTWWRGRFQVSDFKSGRRPPRLVVNGWVQAATTVGAIIGIMLVLFLARMEIADVHYQSHALGQVLASVNKYAVALMFPLTMIFLISFKHLRPALDIVGDVVSHFQFRRLMNGDDQHDDFDLGELAFQGAKCQFYRRDAIHGRMKIILNHFRHEIDGKPKLTVVSHSQGTLIAIEVLNDPELDWLNDEFSEINLLTMGSPFTHIYQHYFRHLYPSLDHPHWSNLRDRLKRWVNIFRVDDFVGTEIEFNAEVEANVDCSNHPVPKKGHNNYWCDRRVLSIIREQKFCQALLDEQLEQHIGIDGDIQSSSQRVQQEPTHRATLNIDTQRRIA